MKKNKALLVWKKMNRAVSHCCRCGGKLKKQFVIRENCRRLVCQKCGEITYLNPKVAAGVIPVTADGTIVLLKRKISPAEGKWTFPAGYVESGETVEQAASRETWEEVRVRVRVGSLIGVYSFPDSGVITIVFAGRVLAGQKPRPGLESAAVKVCDFKKIPWKKLAFRSTIEALMDWKKSHG